MMDHFFGAMYVCHPQGPKITGPKIQKLQAFLERQSLWKFSKDQKKNMLAKDLVLKYLVSSGDKNYM